MFYNINWVRTAVFTKVDLSGQIVFWLRLGLEEAGYEESTVL